MRADIGAAIRVPIFMISGARAPALLHANSQA
jgi:hypothetical protein